jgi:mono/diheme cytochrome c family protein
MRRQFLSFLAISITSPAFAQLGPDPAKTYAENCARCHQLDGKGMEGAYPGLAGDRITNGPAPAAIRLLLDGKGEMPAFRDRLTDEQMAAALSYTRTHWGNMAGAVPAADFARIRSGRK